MILMILCFASCASGQKTAKTEDTEEETVEEEKEEKSKKKEKKKEKAEPTEEPTASPRPTLEPVDSEPALYTESFSKVTNYDLYNNETNSIDGNDLSEKLLWLEGEVKDYTDDRHALILYTDEGDWAVSCGGGGTDEYYQMARSLVGERVRVFCGYVGYSDTHKLPLVSFCPNAYTDVAYRVETPDNEFRLTYPDSYLEVPDLDTVLSKGNMKYKVSNAWSILSDDEDGTILMGNEGDAPQILIVQFEEFPDEVVEGMTDEEILNELAEELSSGDEVLRSEPFKIMGREAINYEMSWVDDSMPVPMDLYSYIILGDGGYYFMGIGEPYLIGETNKKILGKIADTIIFEDGDVTTAKADDKREEKAKATEAPKTTKEDTKPAEEAKPTEAPAKKSSYPTKSEILGKSFSQYMDLTFVYNGETMHEAEEIGPAQFYESDLKGYNESNGTLSYSENMDGIIINCVLQFSYDANGKITYSGPITAEIEGGAASGSMSGKAY